jgi:uncharacterized phiE125 gp8 family phage protein
MQARFSLTQSTAPAAEPVSTTEARLHLKVETNADDALIDDLITEARQYVENQTGRQLIDATWKMYLDGFPADAEIVLPKPPLDSVTLVQYVDTDGDTQTLAATEYQVTTADEPARIVEAYDKTWPDTRTQPDAVIVTYKSGYGTTGSTVPVAIRNAMKLFIAHRYEFRQPVVFGSTSPIALAIESSLAPYTVGFVW